jgi:DNA-binding CsgD family transcriptional regulator
MSRSTAIDGKEEEILHLLARGFTPFKISTKLGMSRMAVHRYCERHRKEAQAAIARSKKLQEKDTALKIDFVTAYNAAIDVIKEQFFKADGNSNISDLKGLSAEYRAWLEQSERFYKNLIGVQKIDLTTHDGDLDEVRQALLEIKKERNDSDGRKRL